ncbi:MAG: radical SAM protein, partial [Chitinophagaceae bacterium]
SHLETLAKQKFTRMSLGVQDLDPKVQDIIHRIQTFQEIKNATLSARDLGYTSINFDLIYGLPLQTLDSVNMTIDKVCELMPDRIALYSFGFIPWVKPGHRKFTEADLPNDNYKRLLYETSKAKLLNTGYIEIGMDHFALPHDSLYTSMQEETLHRNFMGYTTAYSKISLALGVSSISDSWNAFAQNYKTLEQYTQTIEKGKLPIMRGHLLNEEDLLIRKHILNLMCQFETEITDTEKHLPCIQESIHRLEEMRQDELVIIEDNKIKIPIKGIPFVRNVCMAFDVRLWRNVPTTRMFSSTI